MEPPFDGIDGVISTTSGYSGGHTENPTYEEVCSGGSGHAEVVQVIFDPAKARYENLLEVFWRNIDPTTENQQFCDRGTQYRPGIFYLDEKQKLLAESSLKAIKETKTFPENIVTEITKASKFYPAEEYHQKFYKNNSARYNIYRSGSGRDKRLKELWKHSGHK